MIAAPRRPLAPLLDADAALRFRLALSTMASSRADVTKALTGTDLSATRVLMVGAGGIGCELVKNLVLSGFKDITMIDLDTIDYSNLNRQFLFRAHHVQRSKALVAREAALEFPHDDGLAIAAHHGNIPTQPMLTAAAARVITGVFKNRWRTLMAVDDVPMRFSQT